MKFDSGDFFETLLRNSKFCENQAKISGILYVFFLPALSLIEMVSIWFIETYDSLNMFRALLCPSSGACVYTDR
jgi:hypothetical protein